MARRANRRDPQVSSGGERVLKLSELMRDLPVVSEALPDVEVTGIRHHSRAVRPGELFVTWKGTAHDGLAFVGQAVDRGAVAVLVDRPKPAGFEEVPWLVIPEPRQWLGTLARRVYGAVEKPLTLVGVTGTNGKSTVVELVGSLLDASGRPAARFGTLGFRFPGLEEPAGRTTPEASDLYRMLHQAAQLGAKGVALEVSSHALAQGRVEGLRFDVGVFLNLTPDHLDFHGDLENYFAAKRKLFDQLKENGRVVVGVDDPFGQRLSSQLKSPITFGREGCVRAGDLELDEKGIRGELLTPRGRVRFESHLLGSYNIWNILAAAAVAEALELEHGALVAALESVRPLPGRLEPIDVAQGFPVLIDYAHTPAALKAAIEAARDLGKRPVVLVFGCGGERDPSKREPMGRIAGELAALPIATNDNPRGEDPLAILAAIEKGLIASGNAQYRIVPDRREAIRRAVAVAAKNRWTVLVAGKGHEREQIIGNQRLPFSDREELIAALEEWRGQRVGG